MRWGGWGEIGKKMQCSGPIPGYLNQDGLGERVTGCLAATQLKISSGDSKLQLFIHVETSRLRAELKAWAKILRLPVPVACTYNSSYLGC